MATLMAMVITMMRCSIMLMVIHSVMLRMLNVVSQTLVIRVVVIVTTMRMVSMQVTPMMNNVYLGTIVMAMAIMVLIRLWLCERALYCMCFRPQRRGRAL